jgi:hypothetical protein
MNWIYLAQDRDQWRTLVNRVTKFGFHKILGISRVAGRQLAFQGLCSMALYTYIHTYVRT